MNIDQKMIHHMEMEIVVHTLAAFLPNVMLLGNLKVVQWTRTLSRSLLAFFIFTHVENLSAVKDWLFNSEANSDTG